MVWKLESVIIKHYSRKLINFRGKKILVCIVTLFNSRRDRKYLTLWKEVQHYNKCLVAGDIVSKIERFGGHQKLGMIMQNLISWLPKNKKCGSMDNTTLSSSGSQKLHPCKMKSRLNCRHRQSLAPEFATGTLSGARAKLRRHY
jgi:hypothetical protein